MDQALSPTDVPPASASGASALPATAPAGALRTGPLARLHALPPRNRLLLGVGAAGLLAVLVALLLWGRDPDYKVLYSNLSDKDGGAIVAQLAQMNVPYRYTEGGGAILVPADKVHDARLKLATAGLPKGSITGYELMDNARFGQTQFQERLNFQRGLEGELTRSIMSLGSVQAARVHLALPQQNGFFREQQKPSASVLLTLHPGRALDRTQLAGIVHLVSSSVPEMNPKAVSILDQSGTLLSGPDGAMPQPGLDAAQLAYVHQVEKTLQQRVMDILEPVVGRDNLRASVAAEIDFTQTEATAESFRPNQGSEPAAVRSMQNAEVGPGAASAPPTGVPGAQSNQPPVPATAPINGASAPLQTTQQGSLATGAKRESVINYEVDKTVRVTRNATGAVKRLNAAVVINHRAGVDAKGKPTNTALSQEELDKLTELVQESIGYSKDRGDSVKVVSAPFQAPAGDKDAELPLWRQPWVLELLRTAGMPAALVLVAAMLLLGLVRPALRPPPPPKPEDKEDALAALAGPAGTQLDAVVSDEDGEQGLSLQGGAAGLLAEDDPQPVNQQLEKARALARQHPLVVANILRDWVNKEG